MLVYLFTMGCAIYKEFGTRLDSDKWVWPLPMVNKQCGEVKSLVFESSRSRHGSLPTFNLFFVVQRCTSGEIFIKIQSVKSLTNNVPLNTLQVMIISWMGFYGSNDLTNSVRASGPSHRAHYDTTTMQYETKNTKYTQINLCTVK